MPITEYKVKLKCGRLLAKVIGAPLSVPNFNKIKPDDDAITYKAMNNPDTLDLVYGTLT